MPMKKYLYIMLGYPGSGKSHVARQLTQTTGATRVSQDGLRKKLFDNPRDHMDPQDDELLLAHMNEITKALLESGKSVIYDANVETFESRALLYEMASSLGADSYLLWIKVPLAISIKRNGPPHQDSEFTRVYSKVVADYGNRFDKPRVSEQTIVIDGQKSIQEQLTRVPS